MLGVLRLPVLDGLLDELETLEAAAFTADVVGALERLAELLTREMLGASPETVPRRARIVELIRRADDGRLPALAADEGDAFGVELRAMLASDDDLRVALGRLHPLALGATSVAPSGRWRKAAGELASSPAGPAIGEATRRVLAALVRAPIASRPDLLVGGLRFPNQRLARTLLWYASVALAEPAELLGTVGLRMGTSGRTDAVVRDVALANTCAALLGESSDPGAPAALASMQSQITNRVVRKQVDRALEALATRAGTTVPDLVDLALPTFGLDDRGREELAVGKALAIVEVGPDDHVVARWRLADGAETPTAPDDLATSEPAAVAEVHRLISAVGAALAEERGRLEKRLGSTRSWSVPVWRRRFLDHPLAGGLGRRIVWLLDEPGGTRIAALPVARGWIGVDERPVPEPSSSTTVSMWHPAEAGPASVAAWRATLAARDVRQPFRQVDREVFVPLELGASPNADRRFGGRIVAHATLRTLLRGRGWAVPSLGPWDEGAEATGWRTFDDGLRAELR